MILGDGVTQFLKALRDWLAMCCGSRRQARHAQCGPHT